MMQTIHKRLLISGAAAIGMTGFLTPSAFAWSGNSKYGDSHNKSHMSYDGNKTHNSYVSTSSNSPCRMTNSDSTIQQSRYRIGQENENGSNGSGYNKNNNLVSYGGHSSTSEPSPNSYNYMW